MLVAAHGTMQLLALLAKCTMCQHHMDTAWCLTPAAVHGAQDSVLCPQAACCCSTTGRQGANIQCLQRLHTVTKKRAFLQAEPVYSYQTVCFLLCVQAAGCSLVQAVLGLCASATASRAAADRLAPGQCTCRGRSPCRPCCGAWGFPAGQHGV